MNYYKFELKYEADYGGVLIFCDWHWIAFKKKTKILKTISFRVYQPKKKKKFINCYCTTYYPKDQTKFFVWWSSYIQVKYSMVDLKIIIRYIQKLPSENPKFASNKKKINLTKRKPGVQRKFLNPKQMNYSRISLFNQWLDSFKNKISFVQLGSL